MQAFHLQKSIMCGVSSSTYIKYLNTSSTTGHDKSTVNVSR